MSKVDIKIDSNELLLTKKTHRVIVFVNDKEVEIQVYVNDNERYATYEIDFDYMDDVELTDEEADELHEFVHKMDL